MQSDINFSANFAVLNVFYREMSYIVNEQVQSTSLANMLSESEFVASASFFVSFFTMRFNTDIHSIECHLGRPVRHIGILKRIISRYLKNLVVSWMPTQILGSAVPSVPLKMEGGAYWR
uniref:Uncharacterized protein n=1 Tax=Parascaris equorum TaxID=6256 RepID=A0A914SDG6_PAREQ